MESLGECPYLYDTKSFQKEITDSVIKFLAPLYSDDSLSKKRIQFFVDHHNKSLNGGLFEILKNKVETLLKTLTPNEEQECLIKNVTSLFNQYQNMYNGLETEYQRIECFKQTGAYIPSIPCVLGQGYKEKEENGQLIMDPVNKIGRFVPMRSVLKGFLEMPGVLQTILDYMNVLQNRESPVIENIVQGKLWKEKIVPLFEGKTVLPLILYYDDLQTEDFGTHTSDGKIGAIYYSIPSLPPEFQSALENIFTTFIFYSNDKMNITNMDLYGQLLNELKFLEEEGIEVVNEAGESQRIYFALVLLVGDNLAVHSLLAFVEGFTANFPCRICRVSRKDMISQISEDEDILRNRVNYADDLATNNVSTTGIKGECIFNGTKSYHCAENYAFDLMHGVELGFGNRVMAGIIGVLVSRKRMNYEMLNSRIQSFHFGRYESSNKPSEISAHHVEAGKLPLSAAECLCLIRYFGIMMIDLIDLDEDNDIWDLYQVLTEMLGILTAPTINRDLLPYLQNLIDRFLELHLRCFPQWPITPKLHHLLHAVRIILIVGPLSKLTCYRYESKHKDYRENARISFNRKNLPLTMTERNQMKLCFRLLQNVGLVTRLEMPKPKLISVLALEHFSEIRHLLSPELKRASIIPWILIKGTKYCERSVVVIGIGEEFPVFGEIISILFLPDTKTVQFLVKKYLVERFNPFINAYQVILTQTWACVSHCNLITHVPTIVRLACDEKYYIAHRHII